MRETEVKVLEKWRSMTGGGGHLAGRQGYVKRKEEKKADDKRVGHDSTSSEVRRAWPEMCTQVLPVTG